MKLGNDDGLSPLAVATRNSRYFTATSGDRAGRSVPDGLPHLEQPARRHGARPRGARPIPSGSTTTATCAS